MYVIKRVWKVKPRQGREAATIASRIGDLYHEAGQRSEVRVYFNGTTLPGKRNRLFTRDATFLLVFRLTGSRSLDCIDTLRNGPEVFVYPIDHLLGSKVA